MAEVHVVKTPSTDLNDNTEISGVSEQVATTRDEAHQELDIVSSVGSTNNNNEQSNSIDNSDSQLSHHTDSFPIHGLAHLGYDAEHHGSKRKEEILEESILTTSSQDDRTTCTSDSNQSISQNQSELSSPDLETQQRDPLRVVDQGQWQDIEKLESEAEILDNVKDTNVGNIVMKEEERAPHAVYGELKCLPPGINYSDLVSPQAFEPWEGVTNEDNVGYSPQLYTLEDHGCVQFLTTEEKQQSRYTIQQDTRYDSGDCTATTKQLIGKDIEKLIHYHRTVHSDSDNPLETKSKQLIVTDAEKHPSLEILQCVDSDVCKSDHMLLGSVPAALYSQEFQDCMISESDLSGKKFSGGEVGGHGSASENGTLKENSSNCKVLDLKACNGIGKEKEEKNSEGHKSGSESSDDYFYSAKTSPVQLIESLNTESENGFAIEPSTLRKETTDVKEWGGNSINENSSEKTEVSESPERCDENTENLQGMQSNDQTSCNVRSIEAGAVVLENNTRDDFAEHLNSSVSEKKLEKNACQNKVQDRDEDCIGQLDHTGILNRVLEYTANENAELIDDSTECVTVRNDLFQDTEFQPDKLDRDECNEEKLVGSFNTLLNYGLENIRNKTVQKKADSTKTIDTGFNENYNDAVNHEIVQCTDRKPGEFFQENSLTTDNALGESKVSVNLTEGNTNFDTDISCDVDFVEKKGDGLDNKQTCKDPSSETNDSFQAPEVEDEVVKRVIEPVNVLENNHSKSKLINENSKVDVQLSNSQELALNNPIYTGGFEFNQSDDIETEFFYDEDFAEFDAHLAEIDMNMLNSGELKLCASFSDVLSRNGLPRTPENVTLPLMPHGYDLGFALGAKAGEPIAMPDVTADQRVQHFLANQGLKGRTIGMENLNQITISQTNSNCNDAETESVSSTSLPYENMFLLPHEAAAMSDSFDISDFEQEHFFTTCQEAMCTEEMTASEIEQHKLYMPYDGQYQISSSDDLSELGYSPLFSPAKELSSNVTSNVSGSHHTSSSGSLRETMETLNYDPYTLRQNYMLTFDGGGNKIWDENVSPAESSEEKPSPDSFATVQNRTPHYNTECSSVGTSSGNGFLRSPGMRSSGTTPDVGNKPSLTTWAQQKKIKLKESSFLKDGFTTWQQLQERKQAQKYQKLEIREKSKSMPNLTYSHCTTVVPRRKENNEVVEEKDETKRYSGTLIEIYQRMKSNADSDEFDCGLRSPVSLPYCFQPFGGNFSRDVSSSPTSDRSSHGIPSLPSGHEVHEVYNGYAFKTYKAVSQQTSPTLESLSNQTQSICTCLKNGTCRCAVYEKCPMHFLDRSVQTSLTLLLKATSMKMSKTQQTSWEEQYKNTNGYSHSHSQSREKLVKRSASTSSSNCSKSLYFANRTLPDLSFLGKSSTSISGSIERAQNSVLLSPGITLDQSTGKIYALIPRKSKLGQVIEMQMRTASAADVKFCSLPTRSKSSKRQPLQKSSKMNNEQVPRLNVEHQRKNSLSSSSNSSSGIESGSDYSLRSPKPNIVSKVPPNSPTADFSVLNTMTVKNKCSPTTLMTAISGLPDKNIDKENIPPRMCSEESLALCETSGKKPLKSCLRKRKERRGRSMSDPYAFTQSAPNLTMGDFPWVKCTDVCQNSKHHYTRSVSLDARDYDNESDDSLPISHNSALDIGDQQDDNALPTVCSASTCSIGIPRSESDSQALISKCCSQAPVDEDNRVKKTVSFANEVHFHSPSGSPCQTPCNSPHVSQKRKQLKLNVQHPLVQEVTKAQQHKDHTVVSDSDGDSPPGEFRLSPTTSVPHLSSALEPAKKGEFLVNTSIEGASDEDSPPVEFQASPNDSVSSCEMPMITTPEIYLELTVSKRGLVLDVIQAAEILVAHFAEADDPLEKVRLGCSKRNPVIAQLVVDHLCPAMYHLVVDGLKQDIPSLFGKVKNSEWRVVEASTELGPSTKALYELTSQLKTLAYLTTSHMRFNAFIFGLLNMRALDFWLCHIRTQERLLARHYSQDAFLPLTLTTEQRGFEELRIAIQPLNSLPFQVEYTIDYVDSSQTSDKLSISSGKGDSRERLSISSASQSSISSTQSEPIKRSKFKGPSLPSWRSFTTSFFSSWMRNGEKIASESQANVSHIEEDSKIGLHNIVEDKKLSADCVKSEFDIGNADADKKGQAETQKNEIKRKRRPRVEKIIADNAVVAKYLADSSSSESDKSDHGEGLLEKLSEQTVGTSSPKSVYKKGVTEYDFISDRSDEKRKWSLKSYDAVCKSAPPKPLRKYASMDQTENTAKTKSKFSWNNFGSGLMKIFDKVLTGDKKSTLSSKLSSSETALTEVVPNKQELESHNQVNDNTLPKDNSKIAMDFINNEKDNSQMMTKGENEIQQQKRDSNSHENLNDILESKDKISSLNSSISNGTNSSNWSSPKRIPTKKTSSMILREACFSSDLSLDSSSDAHRSIIDKLIKSSSSDVCPKVTVLVPDSRRNSGLGLAEMELAGQEVRYARASDSCTKPEEDELVFEEGDWLIVEGILNDDWMVCRLHNQQGLVQICFVKEYSEFEVFMYLHGDFYS